MAVRGTATRRGARTTKPAPAPEVEELEDVEEIGDDVEELELDEPEELVEEPVKPARRTRAAKPATPAKTPARRAAAPVEDDVSESTGPTYDSNWLADHVNETCGTAYDARTMRVLLRKLAHDGVIDREVGTDRSRYTFPKGAADVVVKQVIKHVKAGAVEETKAAGIARAKETRAARATAAAPAKTATATRTRTARKR